MNIYVFLVLFALGIWFDVVLYRWLRKRWPTVALLLVMVCAASYLVQVYRIYNRRSL